MKGTVLEFVVGLCFACLAFASFVASIAFVSASSGSFAAIAASGSSPPGRVHIGAMAYPVSSAASLRKDLNMVSIPALHIDGRIALVGLGSLAS